MREEYLKAKFPRLREGAFQITSPATPAYNCLAWAAGDDTQKWYPDPWGIYAWPEKAEPHDSLTGWIQAFGTMGYTSSVDGSLEEGFEKIAIYALGPTPQHIARQLPSGMWTSKLGNSEDIEHEIEGLEGPDYGAVVVFLRRPTLAED
jgi:hypothetical protein